MIQYWILIFDFKKSFKKFGKSFQIRGRFDIFDFNFDFTLFDK